jgi:hypothetical protein
MHKEIKIEGDFTNQKSEIAASFAKLTLEGEGDAFGFISNVKQCETTTNRTKMIS